MKGRHAHCVAAFFSACYTPRERALAQSVTRVILTAHLSLAAITANSWQRENHYGRKGLFAEVMTSRSRLSEHDAQCAPTHRPWRNRRVKREKNRIDAYSQQPCRRALREVTNKTLRVVVHRRCADAFEEEALRMPSRRKVCGARRNGVLRRRGQASRFVAAGVRESEPGLKFAPVGKIIVRRTMTTSKRSKMLSFEGHIRRDFTVRKISKGFRMNLSDVVSE
ncbi:hypothetical protein [Paraburkholderia unamae]|uniref:Uncharacterized protein n=2 Tax=Paraburkholderia unamae TaxID=219649 RepID=A0ABX5KP11_9BURK|nr:hypothetical protein [Paraburkholderia unamae]PVX83111.1 hypothetical protein C7402_10717 [Paraburkholderia unamae]RAR59901.1 hypothetical protein C7401_11030 [Paraburkholderia unamae]